MNHTVEFNELCSLIGIKNLPGYCSDYTGGFCDCKLCTLTWIRAKWQSDHIDYTFDEIGNLVGARWSSNFEMGD